MNAKRMKEHKNYKKTKETNKKKIFVAIIILIGIIFSGVVISKKVETNTNSKKRDINKNDIENMFEKSFEEKEFGKLKMKDIKIKVTEGVSTFEAIIENKDNKNFKAKDVYIIFKQENGEEMIRFKYKLDNIEKGSSKDISLVSTIDLTIANDIIIE